MGWTFLYDAPDKQIVIDECINPSGWTSGKIRKCTKHSVVGNELWSIWESNTGDKTIVLFLLSKHMGNWGYKDMGEAMHPYYYKCPLYFLEEVPVANQEWRNKVLEYHSSLKSQRDIIKRVSVGKIVTLRDSKPSKFRVVSLDPLIGEDVESDSLFPEKYKLVKARIIDVQEQ